MRLKPIPVWTPSVSRPSNGVHPIDFCPSHIAWASGATCPVCGFEWGVHFGRRCPSIEMREFLLHEATGNAPQKEV